MDMEPCHFCGTDTALGLRIEVPLRSANAYVVSCNSTACQASYKADETAFLAQYPRVTRKRGPRRLAGDWGAYGAATCGLPLDTTPIPA